MSEDTTISAEDVMGKTVVEVLLRLDPRDGNDPIEADVKLPCIPPKIGASMHAEPNHRLDLRDNPGEHAAGAQVQSYDGTWLDHGWTTDEDGDPNEPYPRNSAGGRVALSYDPRFKGTHGSPYKLTLENRFGVAADAAMTHDETRALSFLLNTMLEDEMRMEDEQRG